MPRKTKVELELTATEIAKLRRMFGIQTKTNPSIVLKSLLTTLLADPNQLEILQYEKK